MAYERVSFSVGDSVNGCEILEVKNEGGRSRELLYRVLRACCNTEMWLTHGRLCVLRRQDRVSVCQACDGSSDVRRAKALRQHAAVRGDGCVSVPGWGATLGPMGFRGCV